MCTCERLNTNTTKYSMASLLYNLVKAEQLVDGRLTTMLNYSNYTDNSIKYPAHTLDKRTFFGKKT